MATVAWSPPSKTGPHSEGAFDPFVTKRTELQPTINPFKYPENNANLMPVSGRRVSVLRKQAVSYIEMFQDK